MTWSVLGSAARAEGLLSLIYVPVFRQNRLDPCLACLRWSGVVLSLYDSYLSLIWPSSYPCLGINLSSFINLLINHRLIETLSLIILPFPYLAFPNRMFFLMFLLSFLSSLIIRMLTGLGWEHWKFIVYIPSKPLYLLTVNRNTWF